MSKLKLLAPQMKEIREQHKDNRAEQQKAMMELTKREKANPVTGCLPMVLQIPVFFALYKVLFVTIEMRHTPFYGWIQDLSAPDPMNLFTAFNMIPWDPPALIPAIGIWPILMGASMWLQQRLNPQPADRMQARIFQFLPIFFTFLLASFPAGLVIYWTWNNLLSIAQQWVIMRREGVKNPAAV
jgi:YidC/Oxa1 family membrane protein insertase